MTKLLIAVPSKGRLQENTIHFFKRAGLSLSQQGGARDYRGGLVGIDNVEIVFLSASEIVSQLVQGNVHFGVTGEDLVQEAISEPEQKVVMLIPLGFGYADVVVAVPQGWIDVCNLDDLEDVASLMRHRKGQRLRVATKYHNLTRGFFRQKGIADYRIVESHGATEGAPASNASEIIVDITTTGATLAANGLKVLDDGVILRSQAHLVASLQADWDDSAKNTARLVLNRIQAEEEARTTREIRSDDAVIRCDEKSMFQVVDSLIEGGAQEVSVRTLDYVFKPDNPLVEQLLSRISSV